MAPDAGLPSVPEAGSLLDVARRVVWFRTPEETLENETFFLNHVMIHGLAEDIVRTRRHLGDEAFRNALRHAHPGIWDRHSWAFWHLVLDMGEPPPVPVRMPGIDASLIGFGGPPQAKRDQVREDPARRPLAGCETDP